MRILFVFSGAVFVEVRESCNDCHLCAVDIHIHMEITYFDCHYMCTAFVFFKPNLGDAREFCHDSHLAC